MPLSYRFPRSVGQRGVGGGIGAVQRAKGPDLLAYMLPCIRTADERNLV